MKQFILYLGIAIVLLVGIYLVRNRTQSPQEPIQPSTQEMPVPIMTMETQGGMCPNGQCQMRFTVLRTGIYEYQNTSGEIKNAPLSAEQKESLEKSIQSADFARIKEKKFTGTCPIAFDGVEYVYTFYLDSGMEVIKSCETVTEGVKVFEDVQQLIRTISGEDTQNGA